MSDFIDEVLESKRTMQRYIEAKYSKKQINKMILDDLQNKQHDRIMLACLQLPSEFVFSLVVNMARQQSGEAPLSVLAGMMWNHCPDPEILGKWLEIAVALDIVDYDPEEGKFFTVIKLSANAVARIRSYQYPMPMITKPKKLWNNRMTGYLTEGTGIGSVMCNVNHTDEDVCLDNLNRLNSIAFKINAESVANLSHEMKQKEEDYVDSTAFELKEQAFSRKLKEIDQVVTTINMVNEGVLYFTHKYDHRGRVYSQGYHLNYQGDSWQKAILDLAEEEYLVD